MSNILVSPGFYKRLFFNLHHSTKTNQCQQMSFYVWASYCSVINMYPSNMYPRTLGLKNEATAQVPKSAVSQNVP